MSNVVPFAPAGTEAKPQQPPASPPFAELAVTTNFSFLRGASHPEELVRRAAELELAAIAITDRNTLAGVVRGHVMLRVLAEEAQIEGRPAPTIKYVVGCRLSFRDGTPDIFAWPTDRTAYGRLCRLLTEGNLRAEKGQCHLDRADLLQWGKGIILGVTDGSTTPEKERTAPVDLPATLAALATAFPGNVRLMATCTYGGNDGRRLARLARIAEAGDIPLMATNDVHYHLAERRSLQDVVTCIREKTTLREAGFCLAANAERHLKSPQEMARLFRRYPEAIAETMRVLERINFKLDELQYQYPDEPTGGFASPQEALAHLAKEGARFRYPQGVPDHVSAKLEKELGIIEGRQYAPYFLTVHDIVKYARTKDILCQGRGSAANSVVCFCLGITEVDPSHAKLLFERFISPNRNEPPDIDVDFEHEHREKVMQYVFEKYGRRRAGIAATVISYRTRSAVRDVGKVFGLSEDAIGALASTTWDGLRTACATSTSAVPV